MDKSSSSLFIFVSNSWANAGQQPSLVRDQEGQFIEYPESGLPVGVMQQENASVFVETTLQLKGKRFFIFTDGIIESINHKGEELGVEGLQALLQKNKGLSPKREVEKVVATI